MRHAYMRRIAWATSIVLVIACLAFAAAQN